MNIVSRTWNTPVLAAVCADIYARAYTSVVRAPFMYYRNIRYGGYASYGKSNDAKEYTFIAGVTVASILIFFSVSISISSRRSIVRL